MTVYFPVWHLHCTRAWFTVLMWCRDELAIHSCPVHSFSCRSRFGREDCSTIGVYCVTIPWQQIKSSPHVTVADVLPHVTVERRHLGRWCSETVTDGLLIVPRTFILCENKQGWICSNASTSLKNLLFFCYCETERLSGLCEDERAPWKHQHRQARFYSKGNLLLSTRSRTFAALVSKWYWQVFLGKLL